MDRVRRCIFMSVHVVDPVSLFLRLFLTIPPYVLKQCDNSAFIQNSCSGRQAMHKGRSRIPSQKCPIAPKRRCKPRQPRPQPRIKPSDEDLEHRAAFLNEADAAPLITGMNRANPRHGFSIACRKKFDIIDQSYPAVNTTSNNGKWAVWLTSIY